MTTLSTWGYDVRGEDSRVLEIDIYDRIGRDLFGGGVTAKDVREKIKNADKPRTIKVRINSGGGAVFDALAVYNMLVDHSARVEVTIDALAASAASLLAMAGDEIRAAHGAMVMIHDPSGVTIGDARDHRATAELLDKIRGQIADIYAGRTSVSKSEALDLMAAETWMTADEALEKGFVDKVEPVKARPDAYAALDLSAAKHPPQGLLRAVAAAHGGAEAAHAQQLIGQLDRLGHVGRRRYGESRPAHARRIAAALREVPASAPTSDQGDLEDQVMDLVERQLGSHRSRATYNDLIDRAADAHASRDVGRDAPRRQPLPPAGDTRDLIDRAADAYAGRSSDEDTEDRVMTLVERQLGTRRDTSDVVDRAADAYLERRGR